MDSEAAVERGEALTQDAPWVRLEDTAPSEPSGSEAACYGSLVCNVQNGEFHGVRKLISDCQARVDGLGGTECEG